MNVQLLFGFKIITYTYPYELVMAMINITPRKQRFSTDMMNRRELTLNPNQNLMK